MTECSDMNTTVYRSYHWQLSWENRQNLRCGCRAPGNNTLDGEQAELAVHFITLGLSEDLTKPTKKNLFKGMMA